MDSGSASANRPRILVVDDDPKITAFLRRALAYEGYRVDTAGTGPQALEVSRDAPADLVILDIMLPGMDGLEVCRRLRAGGDVPVLMLTARDGIRDRVRGLDSGADDYLVKPFALEELLARARALLRRREVDSRSVLRFADLWADAEARQAGRGQNSVDLRNKEFELLVYFLRHPRRVVSQRALLEEVWGWDFEGESNVVEVTVGGLRKKLETGGLPRLIHTVRHAGYVLREQG